LKLEPGYLGGLCYFIVVVVAVHSLNCAFKSRDHLSGLKTKQGRQRFIKVKQVLKLNP
jgi:hypothetical protein